MPAARRVVGCVPVRRVVVDARAVWSRAHPRRRADLDILDLRGAVGQRQRATGEGMDREQRLADEGRGSIHPDDALGRHAIERPGPRADDHLARRADRPGIGEAARGPGLRGDPERQIEGELHAEAGAPRLGSCS